MTLPYRFDAAPRRNATLAAVVAVWAILAAAVIWLDAAWWIIGILGAFTLPALYDLLRPTRAEFTLGDGQIGWRTARAEARIDLSGIDHLRLDTRLDLSVRLSVVLRSGRKLRVPVPATPPAAQVAQAAQAAGVPLERHHFSLIG